MRGRRRRRELTLGSGHLYHQAESSRPSIALRFSREQVSQM
jgi:hypothetical protein